jgi:hypothetical protein
MTPPSEHADNPHFWLGWLAASIHGHLAKQQPGDRLRADLAEFLGSPVATPELREILRRE